MEYNNILTGVLSIKHVIYEDEIRLLTSSSRVIQLCKSVINMEINK